MIVGMCEVCECVFPTLYELILFDTLPFFVANSTSNNIVNFKPIFISFKSYRGCRKTFLKNDYVKK